MKKNRGKIVDNEYIKYVDWNSAVLWMTKEISLPIEEMNKIYSGNVNRIVFVDRKKEFQMVYNIEDVDNHKKFKRVGQEPQFYWSIYLGKKHPA